METTVNTREQLKEIFDSVETIAIVGCSDRPDRASYAISRYLDSVGYEVIPVNPNHSECAGKNCYPDLHAIPDDIRIDIVVIFRNPRFTADMVRMAIERAERTGERPVIWTQIGVSSPEAERLAKEAGLTYVKNRCSMVEHSHLD